MLPLLVSFSVAPSILPAHAPSQRPLSNEVDSFWRVLMRTHSTRITFKSCILPHCTGMRVHTHTHLRASTTVQLVCLVSSQAVASVQFTINMCKVRRVCVCVWFWGGQMRTEKKRGWSVCTALCGPLCVWESVHVTLLTLLGELCCMTCQCTFVSLFALLPRWNIDSLTVAVTPKRNFNSCCVVERPMHFFYSVFPMSD